MNGDNQKAIELSNKATNMLLSDNLNWQAVALITLGIAYNSIGLVHKSSQAFAQAIAFSSIARNGLTSVVSAAQYARLLIAQGQLRLAARTCDRALEFSSIRGRKGISQAARAFTSLAQIYREWNQLEKAKEFLDKAVELSQSNQNMRDFFEATLEQARWLNASGEPRQAIDLMEQIEFQIREYRLGEFLSEARSIKARLAVYQGDLEAAVHWAAVRGMDSLAGTDYSLEDEFLTYARLLLAQGKYQQVVTLLDRLDKATTESGRKGRWMEIQLLKGLVFEQTGHPRKATLAVQRILQDAEKEGFVRLFLDEGQKIVPLLEISYHSNSLILGSSRAYLHSLIRGLTKKPDGSAAGQLFSKDILTAKELDVLKLLASGNSRIEIANALVITTNTVDTHIKNIYDKLGAHNRVEAIMLGSEIGLIRA
jgi:LuxR family transcriptional regulator, maltose regulon positive regulatory protein